MELETGHFGVQLLGFHQQPSIDGWPRNGEYADAGFCLESLGESEVGTDRLGALDFGNDFIDE
ncbi:hypothetical protein GUI04_12880, partial [Xanthomonas citri pv. citri]|nr:hypothetical protein [Xanthomonas citri pv. citri]MBD3991022.1 hypothetical protein [Xanthomonas citri pv. citri]MBD4019888.1 hypothetical protein [Xanthomonas citri pv. citri]